MPSNTESSKSNGAVTISADRATADIGAAADAITVLTCPPTRRAAKRIVGRVGGGVAVEDYACGMHFAVTERPVASILDLAHELDDISTDHRAFVIRGQPLADIDRERCRRLLYKHEDGTPPMFREVPRRWAILDFDNVPGAYRFDPRDGALTGVHCRSLLPAPWQRCSCWWSLSASAGFRPGVRIKLGFWLARPSTGRELERHLAGAPIDASTLRPVQPIFVAKPILVNLGDPITKRTGLEEDSHATVALPELQPEPAPSERPAAPPGRRFVSGASATVAKRRLDALCRAIERAGVGGRHRCLIWAAARAVELDDAIPRELIAADLIDAARRAGLLDSEADLARQVRNGFKIGIFGAEAAA